MPEYDNTNRGVLFKNDRKETDKHPDYVGSININGVDHWFSAWIKESNAGKKFMSCSIGKPKEQQSAPKRPQQAESVGGGGLDDDIPFLPVPWWSV